MRRLARGSLNAAVSFYGVFIEDTRFYVSHKLQIEKKVVWFFFCIDLGFIGFYLFGSEVSASLLLSLTLGVI